MPGSIEVHQSVDPNALIICLLYWTDIMNTTHYLSTPVDQTIMKSHREPYKGWKVLVEISGNSRFDDGANKLCSYAPRIVVTEQLSIGFKELEVTTDRCFATPAQCIQGGITIARNFIDGRA